MSKTNIAEFPLIHREHILRQELLSALLSASADMPRALHVMFNIYIDMLLILQSHDKDKATLCLIEMQRIMEDRL